LEGRQDLYLEALKHIKRITVNVLFQEFYSMAVAIVQSQFFNHSLTPANAAVQLDSDAKIGEIGVALPSVAKNRPRKASLKPLAFCS
jgi:hypothetical protein